MSVYNRKGGSGKAGSLREQFTYYKRQLRNRLINEQAFKEARGVGTIESEVKTLFKQVDYEKVFNQGITRKVGNQTIRFVGDEAVRIQIASMRQRASKSYQTEQFITNYVDAMISADFDDEDIDEVERELKKLSIDKLTLLIDKGILPSIQYVYSTDSYTAEEKFMEKFRSAVQVGVTKEEVKDIRYKTNQLVRVIKEKYKVLGW